MREPVELTYAKCYDLLAAGGLGRAAVCTPTGPHIVPVNYSVFDESIIFRTTPYSSLGTYARNTQMAFEVDHADHERQLGWSVVATGRSMIVQDPDELAAIRSYWDPRPWAGGVRPLYVRLRWRELTGRRLGSDWTAATEVPVRRAL
jgi:nitroimidazol reductase NimA-like FMN-containing flavoprotein (pyridoxamine 5'-phosphate oxidase superfamily)